MPGSATSPLTPAAPMHRSSGWPWCATSRTRSPGWPRRGWWWRHSYRFCPKGRCSSPRRRRPPQIPTACWWQEPHIPPVSVPVPPSPTNDIVLDVHGIDPPPSLIDVTVQQRLPGTTDDAGWRTADASLPIAITVNSAVSGLGDCSGRRRAHRSGRAASPFHRIGSPGSSESWSPSENCCCLRLAAQIQRCRGNHRPTRRPTAASKGYGHRLLPARDSATHLRRNASEPETSASDAVQQLEREVLARRRRGRVAAH